MAEAQAAGTEIDGRIDQGVGTLGPHRPEGLEVALGHLVIRAADGIAVQVDDRRTRREAGERILGQLRRADRHVRIAFLRRRTIDGGFDDDRLPVRSEP